MSLLPSALSLLALLPVPQQPNVPKPTGLGAQELVVLREAVRDSLLAEIRYDSSGPKTRKQLAVERRSAIAELRQAVQAWERRTSRSLVHDGEALAAAFVLAGTPDAPPDKQLGAVTLQGDARNTWAEYVPKGYDSSVPFPTVVLLAGSDQFGDGAATQKYLTDTWQEAADREHTLVLAPVVSKDLDLDAVDANASQDLAAESERIGAVLGPVGAAWRQLHTSRDRMVLDCGRGASAFGLRLLSKFPDRFAAAVLRWPVLDENLRLEALSGIPILLVRSPETAAACQKIRNALHAQSPGCCQILTPPGKYRYANDAGISEWVRHNRRVAMPMKVVVAPSDDRFRRAHWLNVRKSDPVGKAPWQDAPRIIAAADREKNRLVVTTRGVQEFTLYVGPALVDVEKFTLVLNGKESTVQLSPTVEFARQHVRQRSDARQIFTARLRVVVP